LGVDMPRILVLGSSESELMPIAASIAGMSYFVTSAWDFKSLADAVAKGSPDITVIFTRIDEKNLSYTKNLILHYDQIGEAPIIVICESSDIPELQTPFIEDFILYPYNNKELSLRIDKILNKHHKTKDGSIITIGDLVINTQSYEAVLEGKKLKLTYKEFEMLRFIASRTGRVHTREALLNQVWGYEYFGGLRTVDVHIRRIRAKLGPKYENLIQTVHGVGYKFIVDTD
jgi:DNA-binding response OmpR family regulator